VAWWWNFVDYDGDMPFAIIVVLERIEMLLGGAVPLGLAVGAACLRGHLRAISLTSLLVYATGAGLLFDGVPSIVGTLLGYLFEARGDGLISLVPLGINLIVVALAYYGLIVGLAHVRRGHVVEPEAH
jgi:hypothetical protein